MSSCLVFAVYMYVMSIPIGSLSSVNICRYEIPGGALPICTSSTRTGNTIFIDTSMVPQDDEVSCTCSVDIVGMNKGSTTVYVGYEPAQGTTSQCGLRFQTGSRLFTCEEPGIIPIAEEDISQIYFSKTSASANACFILFIDVTSPSEDRRNATVTCFDKEGPPVTSKSTSLTITTTAANYQSTSKASSSSFSETQTMHMTWNATDTETTIGVTNRQTNNGGDTDSNSSTDSTRDEENPVVPTESTSITANTAIIGGAVCGAVAILIIVLVVVLTFRLRRRESKTQTSVQHEYANTTLDTGDGKINSESLALQNDGSIRLNPYDTIADTRYSTQDNSADGTKTEYSSTIQYEDVARAAAIYKNIDADTNKTRVDDNTDRNMPTDTVTDTAYETLGGHREDGTADYTDLKY